MFKRTARCIDCGFLANPYSGVGASGAYETTAVIVTADRRSALYDRSFCSRRVADLESEVESSVPRPKTSLPQGEFEPWETARNEMRRTITEKERSCRWFERFRPGLSFEGHMELQHRRQEWRRTALVALGSAIVGGLIATLPSLIFGHGVTVIIGR